MKRWVLLVALVSVSGCAAQTPSVRSVVPTPQAPQPVQPAASSPDPTPGRPPVRVVVDSLPSREALAVLASIPEPLALAQRVDPPARVPTPVVTPPIAPVPTPVPPNPGVSMPAPDSAADSLRISIESIPTPPTSRPLGAVPIADPVVLVPQPERALPAASAVADTCWRLQVAAPSERAKAVSMQQAAKSLLLVPMRIVPEAGRFKVRSEECLSRPAADALRERAIASGFTGVFLVRELRAAR